MCHQNPNPKINQTKIPQRNWIPEIGFTGDGGTEELTLLFFFQRGEDGGVAPSVTKGLVSQPCCQETIEGTCKVAWEMQLAPSYQDQKEEWKEREKETDK